MLEVIQTHLLNPDYARHFVSEMLCFYITFMLCIGAAALIVLIIEWSDFEDF